MLAQVRQKKLLEHLGEVEVATVKQLVEALDSSPATIRRDINQLNNLGKLRKIRNGAERISDDQKIISNHSSNQISINFDYFDYQEAQRIAEQAVALCKTKDSIYVGTGPIAFLMHDYLLKTSIQVYSNAVPLIIKLLSTSYPHLVVLGGQHIESQGILVSPPSKLNFQGRYLFVDADGLSEAGLTKTAMLAYMEEKRMHRHVEKVVALVGSDKMGNDSGIPVFGLEEIDIVITGNDADPKMRKVLEAKGIEVITV
nr:DeoR family transcriptional regulator [uncultured Cohaesibacter sp.]